MKIFIPVEISSRELMYKVYLCNVLASRGVECYLGSKANISYLSKKSKDFIYLDKGFHHGVSEKIYEILKENNASFVSLDEEGALDFNDGSVLRQRYTSRLFESSEAVFLWGQRQFESLIIDKIDTVKCVISGHPRFQLLKPEYRCLFEEEKNKIEIKYGNFILINTNMGFGNNIRGDNFIVENYGKRFSNIAGIISNDKIKMENVLDLCRDFSKRGIRVVLRPHPEERMEYYMKNTEECEGVFITKEFSSIPWILAASEVIHIDCTTGVEAAMLGKKSISFVSNTLEQDYLSFLPINLSYRYSNLESVVEHCINKANINNDRIVKDRKLLNEFFGFDINSFDIICDNLLSIAKKFRIKPLSTWVFFAIKMDLFIRGLKPRRDDLIRDKLSGLDSETVVKLNKRIKSTNPNFSDVRLRRLNDRLFFFNKRAN